MGVFDRFAIDDLAESFLELGWKFEVFMLYREVDWDQAVEANLPCEAAIKFGASELLEEEHKNFGETLRVLVRDRQMIIALQAANEALDEEVQREGELRQVCVLHVTRH